MPATFGRAVRLRSRDQFQAVTERGQRVASHCLTVLAKPNDVGRDRLGIVASRKLGGAVDRNRAKRRIRDVFRRQYGAPTNEPTAQPPLDVVVIARRELLLAPLSSIETELSAAMRRLRKQGRP
jgi:ribonuclease P protein component